MAQKPENRLFLLIITKLLTAISLLCRKNLFSTPHTDTYGNKKVTGTISSIEVGMSIRLLRVRVFDEVLRENQAASLKIIDFSGWY